MKEGPHPLSVIGFIVAIPGFLLDMRNRPPPMLTNAANASNGTDGLSGVSAGTVANGQVRLAGSGLSA